jgi:hypothetical protein
MKQNKLIKVQINYFGPHVDLEDIANIFNPDIAQGERNNIQVTLLESFFELPINALSHEILRRYVEVSSAYFHMPIVPHTEKIFERLLKPLKSAKRNYSLGDYIATVSTCGIVGEMLTILIWKINEIKLNNKPLSKNMEKVIFGHSFEERLSQDRRLKILKTFGLINERQYQELDSIRGIRNRYLHSWEEKILNEKKDAFNSLKYSFGIFRDITGIGIGDEPGTVKVDPKLLKLFQ